MRVSIDSEARELIQRLYDIENRLISDRIIEETVYSSIKTLERIFGKKSIYGELIRKLKLGHGVSRLDSAVKKVIKKTETSIEVANASAMFPHISVNKNSILSDYLADTKRLPKLKLREFHEFFAELGESLDSAFERGDAKEVKEKLLEYIKILEAEEDYLRENLEEITKDIKYAWSLHNLISHEILHWIYTEFARQRSPGSVYVYSMALFEAYSFTLQKLMHTFTENYVFNKENLLKEVREMYKLIVPRKYGYNELVYKFMRPFIILIGILVLCDSIARKYMDYRNKRIFLQSYSVPTLLGIYSLIEQAISNLRSDEFKEIIRDTLLKTAINQLRKCKDDIIDHLEWCINKLPEYAQKEIFVLKGQNKKENWDNFKEGLLGSGSVLKNNTTGFIASLDLLRIMGYEDEAREYRDRYARRLRTTLDDIADYTKDKESEIYKREEDAIDGVIAVIKEEEEDLAKILREIKF